MLPHKQQLQRAMRRQLRGNVRAAKESLLPPEATRSHAKSGKADDEIAAAAVASSSDRSAPAPTKSVRPKRWFRSAKRWKRGKNTCAPSATCCNSRKRRRNTKP